MTGEQLDHIKKRKRKKNKKPQQSTQPEPETVELQPEQPKKKHKGQLNGANAHQVSALDTGARHSVSLPC
jgi:hypothetical protein